MTDEATAADWILGLLGRAWRSTCRLLAPAVGGLAARRPRGVRALERVASSPPARPRELRAEDRRSALRSAACSKRWGSPSARAWADDPRVTHLAMFALAGARWRTGARPRGGALLFTGARTRSQRGPAPRAARADRRPAHPRRRSAPHLGAAWTQGLALRRRGDRLARARPRARQRPARDPVLTDSSVRELQRGTS